MSTVEISENQILSEIDLEVPNEILNRFSSLVRESGSEDEKTAAKFLANYLEQWEINHKVHFPNIYLSVPKKSSIKITHPEAKEIKAKSPSFSISATGSGELVYIPSEPTTTIEEINSARMMGKESDELTDKIVLTEGFPMPGQVKVFNDKNVAAAIFISPGERIHEGICTSIWGSPDLDSIDNEPKIPVLAINKQDGEALKALCEKGTVKLDFETELDKGWFHCPLIDIFIEGNEEPEKYVLLHGHLDSWHVGIGDNATGNAALIEMARILHKHRDKLKRSIRIAIWPGHSTGRYAGSTWFADQFGLDLDENCIAQVNCDSPGCRWATSYHNINWTSETDDLCKQAIWDAVGKESSGSRPRRSGDYSFNNIGITSFYKLSSTMPEDALKEKGYHPVSGCGGNIEWHTEDDLLYVADLDILKKDIRVYLTSVLRVLNGTIYPFNFIKTADEIIDTIEAYQDAAGDHFNFNTPMEEATKLRAKLSDFYAQSENLKTKDITDPLVREVNGKIMGIARILNLINYTRAGKFRQDPAMDIPPLPDIEPANNLKQLREGSHEYYVTLNHLTRGQNRVTWALRQARNTLG